jgi:aryl-alcohol dehydrogenase-like predicted oxidoreductase
MSDLTLGTAQLGMPYGAVNQTGKPSRTLAVAMVRHAIAYGVSAIDTARTYGDSEEILGEALSVEFRSRARVITKLDPLDSLSPDAEPAEVRGAVEESLRQSCVALRTERLETLLLHRWQHYRAWKGEAWRRLLEFHLNSDGQTDERAKIAVLGASIYTPEEAIEALQEPIVRHLQLPVNLLDWRWKAAGVDRALADRSDVVVHARSALLQGILLHPGSRWPMVEGFDAAAWAGQLEAVARRFERESVADLCFAYVRSQPWIHSVVVGCETMEQLEKNLRLFRLPELSAAQCDELDQTLPPAPQALLNPAQWKRGG